jgi:hypothetical protein
VGAWPLSVAGAVAASAFALQEGFAPRQKNANVKAMGRDGSRTVVEVGRSMREEKIMCGLLSSRRLVNGDLTRYRQLIGLGRPVIG